MRGFCSALRAAAGLCPHQTFVCAKGAVDFLLQGFWRPSGVTGAAGGDMVADCIPVRLSPKMHQGIDDLSQDRIDPGRPLRPFFFTRKLQDVRHGRGSSRASYPPKGLCRIMSSTWPPKMGAPFPGGGQMNGGWSGLKLDPGELPGTGFSGGCCRSCSASHQFSPTEATAHIAASFDELIAPACERTGALACSSVVSDLPPRKWTGLSRSAFHLGGTDISQSRVQAT